MEHEILKSIENVGDIKKLNIDRLGLLCDELRDEIIDKVSETGGHLASILVLWNLPSLCTMFLILPMNR